MAANDELFLRSDAFPLGTLLDSYYDRQVTQLSDRGMASNMIGNRWSDVAAGYIENWPGTNVHLPDGSELAVQQVYRLDTTPAIASIASRRKLQNPDFIVAGERSGAQILMAIDAKFSIDTAKSAQVAAETLAALLDVGPLITDLLPGLPMDAQVINGCFVSPDMPLSHYVLELTRGRLAARVTREQVILLPVQPVPFLKPEPGARLLGPLATVDGFRDHLRTNMLLAMYYFRLARACYGAYAETTTPIFGPTTANAGSEAELERRTIELARAARSSWDVVLQWDAAAGQVRRQREAAYAAMAFPMANRDIRDRIVRRSKQREVVAPSVNSVRRQIGSWYRDQFDAQIGTVLPPVHDMAALLQRIHTVAAAVAPAIETKVDAIIDDVLAGQPHISTANPETA
jgi:hypothetical protein